jgi:hypothetical protein
MNSGADLSLVSDQQPTMVYGGRMMALKSFSPEHLVKDAERSGLFQCRQCGLVWFGKPEVTTCPDGPHGTPVHVVLYCRPCDAVVPIADYPAHVSDPRHVQSDCDTASVSFFNIAAVSNLARIAETVI